MNFHSSSLLLAGDSESSTFIKEGARTLIEEGARRLSMRCFSNSVHGPNIRSNVSLLMMNTCVCVCLSVCVCVCVREGVYMCVYMYYMLRVHMTRSSMRLKVSLSMMNTYVSMCDDNICVCTCDNNLSTDTKRERTRNQSAKKKRKTHNSIQRA